MKSEVGLLNGLSLAGVGQIRARGYRAVDGDFSTYEIISPYSFGFPPEIQVFESQGNEVQTGATRSFGEEFLGGSMAMALSIRNAAKVPGCGRRSRIHSSAAFETGY